MIKLLLAYLLMALLFIGCIRNRNLRQFTVYNKLKTEELSKLKINGVYYRLIPKDGSVNCFVLYNDGTCLHLFGYPYYNNIDASIDYMISDFNKHIKYLKTSQNKWGGYEIKGDTIHIQVFQGYDTQPFYLLNRYYLIKDSVTLEKVMTEDFEKIYDKEELNLFHLYQTNSKPDSTNLFMTNERIKRKLERLYGVKN